MSKRGFELISSDLTNEEMDQQLLYWNRVQIWRYQRDREYDADVTDDVIVEVSKEDSDEVSVASTIEYPIEDPVMWNDDTDYTGWNWHYTPEDMAWGWMLWHIENPEWHVTAHVHE